MLYWTNGHTRQVLQCYVAEMKMLFYKTLYCLGFIKSPLTYPNLRSQQVLVWTLDTVLCSKRNISRHILSPYFMHIILKKKELKAECYKLSHLNALPLLENILNIELLYLGCKLGNE